MGRRLCRPREKCLRSGPPPPPPSDRTARTPSNSCNGYARSSPSRPLPQFRAASPPPLLTRRQAQNDRFDSFKIKNFCTGKKKIKGEREGEREIKRERNKEKREDKRKEREGGREREKEPTSEKDVKRPMENILYIKI